MGGDSACAGCGVVVPGGSDGCQARFEEVLAREFADPALFRVHRLTVDTYSLQHPERYCASAISLAAHLTGLCAALEHDDPAFVLSRVGQWLNRRPRLDKPALPSTRGRLTLLDAGEPDEPLGWAERVGRWARVTWEAHAPLHAQAHAWIAAALAER